MHINYLLFVDKKLSLIEKRSYNIKLKLFRKLYIYVIKVRIISFTIVYIILYVRAKITIILLCKIIINKIFIY